MRTKIAGLTALSLLVAACGVGSRQVVPEAGLVGCQPVTSGALAGAPWDSLVGDWRVTLVATRGPMAGRVARGNLTLRAQAESLRRVEQPGPVTVTVPVVGATDVRVEEVGAVRMGNVQSADPRHPGASLWVSRGADGGVSAVLRIGEEEIGAGRQPFDGGYLVLYLRRVSGSGLYGGWASGVSDEVASGHFCVARPSP